MRKLKLEVEALDVQSFETAGEERNPGSVYGRNHDSRESCWATCVGDTCREATCDGTCDATCGEPASCPVNTYCGTYPEHGCNNSLYYCTDEHWVC